MPAPDEVERFIDSLWMERGLSDNTLAAYRRDLSLFSVWLNEEQSGTLLGVDAGHVQAYLGHRLRGGASPRSSARFLSVIRSFYRWALREGLVVADPTLRIDSPKQGRPLPKSLSEADVDRLLDMLRTVINVTGDAVASVVVAKSEGQLDMDVYCATAAQLDECEVRAS